MEFYLHGRTTEIFSQTILFIPEILSSSILLVSDEAKLNDYSSYYSVERSLLKIFHLMCIFH